MHFVKIALILFTLHLVSAAPSGKSCARECRKIYRAQQRFCRAYKGIHSRVCHENASVQYHSCRADCFEPVVVPPVVVTPPETSFKTSTSPAPILPTASPAAATVYVTITLPTTTAQQITTSAGDSSELPSRPVTDGVPSTTTTDGYEETTEVTGGTAVDSEKTPAQTAATANDGEKTPVETATTADDGEKTPAETATTADDDSEKTPAQTATTADDDGEKTPSNDETRAPSSTTFSKDEAGPTTTDDGEETSTVPTTTEEASAETTEPADDAVRDVLQACNDGCLTAYRLLAAVCDDTTCLSETGRILTECLAVCSAPVHGPDSGMSHRNGPDATKTLSCFSESFESLPVKTVAA